MRTDKKTKYIRVRMSEKEKAALTRHAASMDLSISNYVRQKIMGEDSISWKEIPGIIETWTMLDTLCHEIEKSNDGHLKTHMQKILKAGRK